MGPEFSGIDTLEQKMATELDLPDDELVPNVDIDMPDDDEEVEDIEWQVSDVAQATASPIERSERAKTFGLDTHPPLVDTRFLSVLVTGAPGVGKTVFAASIYKYGPANPILFLDCDGGLMSVRDKPLHVHTMTQSDAIDRVVKLVRRYPDAWSTVVLDSLSSYYLMLLDEIKRKRGAGPDDPNQIQDYQVALILSRRRMRQLTALPLHVVVTALENTRQDELLGIVRTEPSVSGKFAGEVGKYFDMHGNLSVLVRGKKRIRILSVQPTRRFQAKDRTGLFGDDIENPNLARMVAAYCSQTMFVQEDSNAES